MPLNMNYYVSGIQNFLMEEIMSDKEEISKVIQTYIDGMNFSSAEKTKAAFHQNASIVGYLHGDFMEMTLADFSGFVLSQQPSPHDSSTDVTYEVLDVAIEGHTAHVKVKDVYLGITFVDTLSLIKVDDQWKIYNKLFHVQSN